MFDKDVSPHLRTLADYCQPILVECAACGHFGIPRPGANPTDPASCPTCGALLTFCPDGGLRFCAATPDPLTPSETPPCPA